VCSIEQAADTCSFRVSLLLAPDGTQVPRLAVCDFGQGHNAAPNVAESKTAPVPVQL
jgi:hypothetical protein